MSKLPQHIEERFDTLFNSLGYDHVDTCTCGFMEACKCVSGRDKIKSFIATVLEEEKNKVIKEVEDVRSQYEHEVHGLNPVDSFNNALNHVIQALNLIQEDR